MKMADTAKRFLTWKSVEDGLVWPGLGLRASPGLESQEGLKTRRKRREAEPQGKLRGSPVSVVPQRRQRGHYSECDSRKAGLARSL